MLDLCYFVNISSLLQLNLAPSNVVWFQANYALALGSLMNAMVVWQNSLVLHNISKLTSLLLHAFAPLTLHFVRFVVLRVLDVNIIEPTYFQMEHHSQRFESF